MGWASTGGGLTPPPTGTGTTEPERGTPCRLLGSQRLLSGERALGQSPGPCGLGLSSMREETGHFSWSRIRPLESFTPDRASRSATYRSPATSSSASCCRMGCTGPSPHRPSRGPRGVMPGLQMLCRVKAPNAFLNMFLFPNCKVGTGLKRCRGVGGSARESDSVSLS